jgi:hypothetical protein
MDFGSLQVIILRIRGLLLSLSQQLSCCVAFVPLFMFFFAEGSLTDLLRMGAMAGRSCHQYGLAVKVIVLFLGFSVRGTLGRGP